MTSAVRSLLILLCVAVSPAARAETLILCNKTDRVLVVQTGCTVRGVVVPDAAYQLSPGDQTPPITLPGTKAISITDARNPNRVLYQGAIPARADDQFFQILPNLQQPPKVFLMQAPFPRR
jgi:hypothetical protein